jgi:hypothetical protein
MTCLTEPREFLQAVEYHGQPRLQQGALDLGDVPIENQQRKATAGKSSRENVTAVASCSVPVFAAVSMTANTPSQRFGALSLV